MKNLKRLISILDKYDQKKLVLLLIMITTGALLDAIGVASILPFMAVLTDPNIIDTNLFLNTMFQVSNNFGVDNKQQFLFALGIIVFLLLVITLTFKAFTFYVQIRFQQMCEYNIAKRLVKGYLSQNYSWFLNRNSADIGKTILSEVGAIIGYGLNPFLGFVSKGLVIIAIIGLLLFTNPKLTLIISFTLIISYIIIFISIRRYIKFLGNIRLKNNQLRFKSVMEAFGAVKEVKVGGLEENFTKRFSYPAKSFAQAQAASSSVAQIPRFFLEAVGFGGIILFILFMMSKTANLSNFLPILSLYVFAGYRLLPALQVLYSSYAQFTFLGPALDKLYNDIVNLKPSNENKDQNILSLDKNISLKNIHYNYPNSSRTILKDISINIPARSKVGLIGTTGSGKTTLVDIILGLFEAHKGTLEVDGKLITEQNVRSWQRSIGYVPQNIFLSDDTIASNIAFGIDAKDINQEAVEKVTKIANLHDFVKKELPNQYQTTIGERGVRLSGGQRQRIGIARALYHNPQLLILDEATSALDNQTEQAVMDAVNNLGKDITIIIIAHRLNTVKNCDLIFELEKGKLKGNFTSKKFTN
jgi:ATP-binding cassette, subfamily B, bacterial PglK